MVRMYVRQILNLCYRLAIILLLYTISRLVFYLFNQSFFTGNSFSGLIRIFLYGIRFDASTILEYNVLFVILYALPFNFAQQRRYLKILGMIFFIINAVVLLLNFIDVEYFKFTAKRSTADLFSFVFLSDDVSRLIPQFLSDFWYIPGLWILTVVLGYFLMLRIPFREIHYKWTGIKPAFDLSFLFMGVMGLFFIIIRGTGLKPLMMISAARYVNSRNMPLLLNTPFCVMHTLDAGNVDVKTYFPENELDQLYNPEHRYVSNSPHRVNVVIIILESFSKEFVGSLTHEKGYTPNFDSIINKSIAFENGFANGKKSIEGIPAILAGLPALMDGPYITSRYSGNLLDALPSVLKQAGYHTSFFHGGHNGTMGFDMFANLAGIEHYYGMNEYKGPEAYDGMWGIRDEEFLQFFAQKLNSFKQPFFSCVFTLSSHHPYTVPKKYDHLFPKNEPDILRSIRYADFSLGKFFKTIEKMPWYKNTLFVFSADHTADNEYTANDHSINKFRIPIVYFMPGDTALRGRPQTITQQTDIMPSVIDYLGIHQPFVAFGHSIFNDHPKSAVFYLSGIYKFLEGNNQIDFDGDHVLSFVDWRTNKPVANDSLKLKMTNELKAVIQQYHSRLSGNRLTVGKTK